MVSYKWNDPNPKTLLLLITWLPICHQAVLDAFDLLADASADPDVLADGLSILLAKTVKGVQRQFRNKTTAVLKPLFKARVGFLFRPNPPFFYLGQNMK